MTELICVVCALKPGASDSTFQWDEKNPLADKHCPVCKSAATVAVEVFRKFAANRAEVAKLKPPAPVGAAKAVVSSAAVVVEQHLRETAVAAAADTSKILRETHKWQRHVDALRAMLRRAVNLHVVDLWWDGYHFYNMHSWAAGVSSSINVEQFDYVVVRLVNKSGEYRDVTFYINLDDEGLTEVGDVQRS